jgi:hypothetical protein
MAPRGRGWVVQRHEMIALLLARLDMVFRQVMEAKNHGGALGAINAQAKLAKLCPPAARLLPPRIVFGSPLSTFEAN